MYNFKNVFESWQSQDLSILGVSNELEVISWDVALGENAWWAGITPLAAKRVGLCKGGLTQ